MSEPSDVDPALDTALEAVLMVAREPLAEDRIAEGLGATAGEVAGALRRLAADYDGQVPGARRRGFELRCVAGGWRIYSRADQAENVAEFLTAGQTARLSQAALETLAVVAYRQPVSRPRIAAIRGVNVDGVMRTLLLRGLVVEADVEPVTGARRYVTSATFLEMLGIGSLDELPDIAPFLPEAADAEPGDTLRE